MRHFVLVLLLVLGAGWASGVLAQTTGVVSIVIDSRWAGLSAGPVPPTHVVVSWRGGHYGRSDLSAYSGIMAPSPSRSH